MERVDVTGEICPRPALVVRNRLADLEPGDELLVEGDYPPAEANLRRSCSSHGYAVADADAADASATDDGTFALKITVTDEAVGTE